MNDLIQRDYGATVLRVALGTMLLVHSAYLKLVIYTFDGTVQYFVGLGLPPASALLVIATEITAGLALLAGFHTRLAALVSIPVLLGATWAHSANGWLFTNADGGWEYPLFLMMAAIAQFFLGDGALAVGSPIPANFSVRRQRLAMLH
jgi:putative oxidoreductase